MKDTSKEYKNIWKIVAVIVLIGFILFLFGCNSKKLTTYQKETFDSTSIYELSSKIRVLEAENGELTARINELEFFGVEFNTDCDSVLRSALLKAGCNTDSINAIVSSYRSKVKTFADGSIELEGFIKNLKRTKERNEEVIHKQQRLIDSLSEVQKKETHWVKTVTIHKTVTKKRGPYWWVWLLVGYGICVAFPPKKIFGFAKSLVTKK